VEAKSKGQGLAEFALILPALLMLLLGVLEAGRVAWAYISVQEAAREATRYAVSGQPFNATGDPWAFGASIDDGYSGLCLVGIDDFGTCDTLDPTDSSAIDRIEAISNVAIRHARGLAVDRYAIASSVYTATGYYDAANTLGVLIIGQTDDTDGGTRDNAGAEGLNVWVETYYNLEMIDPLYAAIVHAATGGQDFVRVRGSVQMQNEGVDAAMGSVPPEGIATPVPPDGAEGDTSTGWEPVIISPDGTTFEAGSDMAVRIEQHTAGNHYDIHLGSVVLCGNVEANNFGIAEVSCEIPADFTPGEGYELYSTLHGDSVEVAGDVYIDITRIGQPTLLVADSYTWPAGSQITVQLRSHEPHQRYDLYFNGTSIGTTDESDENGDADFIWRIPSETASREDPNPPYDLESLAEGTTTPVVAATGVYVTEPQIVVQGGNTWPARSILNASLRRHAPNRSYDVRCDGDSVGSFTTDSEGRSTSTISCVVPAAFPDTVPPHDYYTITSYDDGYLIGQTDVTIETPTEPYLIVVGGYDWPAGSAIEIQMANHLPDRGYRLYLSDWVAMPLINTDNDGYAQTAYVIPITATEASTYTLRSYDIAAGETTATRTLTVRAVPQISVSEGTIVQPGTFIHMNLSGHAVDTVYDLYLHGILIGSILTDDDGKATFGYDLLEFSYTGGPFVLESRLGSAQAASTEMAIVAADLEVVSIELPENPVFNVTMPITVTVRNTSTVTLSDTSFDLDLYVDPEHAPDPLYPYPPGDFKLWLNYLGPYSTATFVQDVVLYGGGDHDIYARVNTSQYIHELDLDDPDNNMKHVVVSPNSCAALVSEALTTDSNLDSTWSAGWSAVAFGTANDTPATASYSLAGDVISLTSQGTSPVMSNDSASNAGHYLVYRQVSGDFDMWVRLTQQGTLSSGSLDGYARFGLEVRASTSSTARKIFVMRTKSNGIQVGRRTADGGSVSANIIPNTSSLTLPVWVRLVRYGNGFAVYYSSATNVPPDESDWTYYNTFNVTMGDPVLAGLVNSSASGTAANTVKFDNFHMCLDPTNLTGCGEVLETDGLVVVDATNYGENVPRSSRVWTETTKSGYRVMQVLPDGGTTIDTSITTTSPELQYQINFATDGDYYVWVYGAGPNSSGDSLHVGLNGTVQSSSDKVSLNSSDTLSWSNADTSGAAVSLAGVSAGVNVVNVYMREDGASFYKILLSTDANFVPTTDVDQSACSITAPEEPYPPGMMICTSDNAPLLDNGDFEDSPGYQTAWEVPNQYGVNISSENPYEGSLDLRMASYQTGGGFKQPYCYQTFTMPDWITSTTTMDLHLWKSVDQWYTAEVTDTLKVVLRTTGITPTLVSTPTVVARGNESYAYHEAEWDLAPAMESSGQNPVNYAGQSLQLYLYDDSNALGCASFGPSCFATAFYLDDVELDICTTQPVPALESTTAIIRGNLRIVQNGQSIEKQGVRVWAYQQSGAMLTTYSIHDSTYGFYGLDAGLYVLYAEYWDGADLYNALTTRQVSAGVQYWKDLDLY
jgi:hypothetical protein